MSVMIPSLIFAQTSVGGVELNWGNILLGFGPLGLFAFAVGRDWIGNNSERDRLRQQVDEKDKYIQTLHLNMQKDVLPTLAENAVSNREGAKILAEAVDLIREYNDPPPRVKRTRRGD